MVVKHCKNTCFLSLVSNSILLPTLNIIDSLNFTYTTLVNIEVHSLSSKKLQNLLHHNAINTYIYIYIYIYILTILYIICNDFPQCKIHYKGGRLRYSIQSTNFLLCTDISLILFFNINKIYGNYTVIPSSRTITYKFYEL